MSVPDHFTMGLAGYRTKGYHKRLLDGSSSKFQEGYLGQCRELEQDIGTMNNPLHMSSR
jgi:hypothetical protein